MSINLIKTITDQLGGDMVSQIGKFLGESGSATESALGAALPAVLGSVINNASNESSASKLLGMINDGGHDGSIFDNLGGLLGGGADAMSGLLNGGGSLLNTLLGDKLGSLVNIIAGVSGMKRGSSSSLLRMAAPMIMGMIGRYVKKNGLNAKGLLDFLTGQKKHVANAMPGEAASLLGFSAPSSSSHSSSTSHSSHQSSGGGGLWKWLVAVLAILGLFFIIRSCGGTEVKNTIDNATDAVIETTEDVGKATSDAVKGAADAVSDAASGMVNAVGDAFEAIGDFSADMLKAAGDALKDIKFAAGSVGQQMADFFSQGKIVKNKSFLFKALTFDTGSDKIQPSSMQELENLAKVLQAYNNITVRIDGHTDNTGDASANVTLSHNRAKSVKAALIGYGVDGSRITTQGYGSAKPVGDNSTEEGRAANRRIEIVVTGTK